MIKANQYGKNKPNKDTYISQQHQYKINHKWTKPIYVNLSRKWIENEVKYYHIQLPDYKTDHLIVNGIIMESWDGKIPLNKYKKSLNKNKLL